MALELVPIPSRQPRLAHLAAILRLLSGAEKQRFLGWRGFPDAQGKWVDDQGRPIDITQREGDLRPAPILLPVF